MSFPVQQTTDAKASNLFMQEQEEKESVGRLVQNARSFAEVQEATAALHVWAALHPEEHNRMAAVFEQLAMAEESAREAQAEAQAMGLTEQEAGQREQMFALGRQVRAEDAPAVFAPAIKAARRSLAAWQTIHPEDPQISYVQNVLDTEESVSAGLHSPSSLHA